MEQSRVTPFPLRMAGDMRIRAKELAEKQRWSLNTWIKVAVEEKIARDAGRAVQ